jgi:hypothetical protein
MKSCIYDLNPPKVIDIKKEININKETELDRVLINLYKELEINVKKNITHWECWLYIHNWFIKEKKHPFVNNEFINVESLRLNDCFISYSMHDNKYLFDTFTYMSYPIDHKLHDNIMTVNLNYIDKATLQELISKSIFIIKE